MAQALNITSHFQSVKIGMISCEADGSACGEELR